MGEIETLQRMTTFDSITPKDLEDHRVAMELAVCSGFVGEPEVMLRLWRNATQDIANASRILFADPKKAEFVTWIIPKIEEGQFIDAITLKSMADESSETEALGGVENLLSYGKSFYGIEICKQQLIRLVEIWKRGQFENAVKTAVEASQSGLNLSKVVLDLLQASKPLITVESKLYTTEEDVVEKAFHQITTDDETYFIPSYFETLGNNYGHMQREQILLLGAPTGNGKTAFVMQEIDHALDGNFTVDAFLMESSFRQYLSRRIARRQNIPITKFVRKGLLNEDELRRALEEKERVKDLADQIHFAPANSFSALDIDAMIQERKAKTGKPCDLIVIDHLNAMRAMKHGQGATDYSHWVDTMQELKDIAVRENAAILLAAQLSTQAVRESFQGTHRLPTLDAFRGGAPTEGAKVCVILHKDLQDMVKNKPVVEQRMVIVKANDGNTGTVDSLFLGPLTMHIEDVAPVSSITGKPTSLEHYRKTQYGHYLAKLGFDPSKPRGENDDY